MEAANKVVTTAVERPSEARELVKKKEICNRILFILDRGEILYRQLLTEN